MLLFLNLDCVLNPSDAADPQSPNGLPALESVLSAWPQLRLVITSERRSRMTLEQLRGYFSPRLQRRVIATTLVYGALSHARLSREDEILEWLWHANAATAPWLALDDRIDDFELHADRLVPCAVFTARTVAALHNRLLAQAVHGEAVVVPQGDGPWLQKALSVRRVAGLAAGFDGAGRS